MLSLLQNVIDFLDTFKKNNFQIFVVGGAVRELLLNNNVDNWDFATDATPDQILKLFPDGFYDNKFGTVGIPFKKKDKTTVFEVTTFRKEGEYKDLRHPEKVEWAKTIEEDLSRRDFTVNAMALRLTSFAQGKPTYELVDPHGGQTDLKRKSIVAVGEADKRFNEDALRLIRAVRFASELGFFIEEKTRLSIQKNAELITKISWERIRDELFKILASNHPSEGILFLKNLGLLTFIIPEVDICFVIPQKSPKRHHIYDVGTHLIMSLKYCPSKDVVARLATLIH
ncbi:CCA tRNA nucleotidyltransferase, partial [Candidatus Roizmanbacteria bacterium]|nr:CCA tRNA nucleotidyltransferase [Candidatus Roizmanbacteria bacterium]